MASWRFLALCPRFPREPSTSGRSPMAGRAAPACNKPGPVMFPNDAFFWRFSTGFTLLAVALGGRESGRPLSHRQADQGLLRSAPAGSRRATARACGPRRQYRRHHAVLGAVWLVLPRLRLLRLTRPSIVGRPLAPQLLHV